VNPGPTIAIDLNRLRLYARGDALEIYRWLSSRFDLYDFLTLASPVLLIRDELQADHGWTLDWSER